MGENAYLALPKGQLTSGHVLVIPVVHRQSTLQLPEEAVKEVGGLQEGADPVGVRRVSEP